MRKQSAGLMMFRRRGGEVEVLLAHPGGPFWQLRDAGAWTIPKGGIHAGEQPLDSAIREFKEETGFDACPPFIPLGRIVQRSGKIVHAWAFEGDCDPAAIRSNTFTLEWPPRSGHHREFPEVDRAGWFDLEAAAEKILQGQMPFLHRLAERLGE